MTPISRITLIRPSYVVYEHPDLESFLAFAKDFGLERAEYEDNGDGLVFLRGYGVDPYVYVARQSEPGKEKAFLGSGFVARSVEDLEMALKMDGAVEVDISKRPGGGRMVRVPDPNGFPLEVVFGQTERVAPSRGLSRVIDGVPNVNMALQKPRKGMLFFTSFSFFLLAPLDLTSPASRANFCA